MGVVMYAPRSYTREDVCELHTHGGSAAASVVMRLLIRLGARPAGAGEFTRRAFMNGRIDLMQAEAVMGVISARSSAALKAEERQLAGGHSRFIRETQDALTGLLAGLEAHIDYPDEISEEEALSGLSAGLDALIGKLESAVNERGARILREGLRVALCGCPNAGKSTLFNALLGEDRAIVTDIPGTTRDVLDGAFTLDGNNVLLQDTAGLRESGDAVERIGVERAKKALAEADVRALVLDGASPLTEEDKAALFGLAPQLIILSKGDLAPVLTADEVRAAFGDVPTVAVCAPRGEGMEALKEALAAFVPEDGAESSALSQARHVEAARRACAALSDAVAALSDGMPLDVAAVDLSAALDALGEITGETMSEKVIDEVFAKFCVGK